MYANASEAMKGLTHKQTGELLPTKVVARNTKLVYLDDDLIGLRFHDTIIAKYERDGVRIDTRDRHNGKGWFTVTTWDRIDAFTPARTFQNQGLRWISLDPAAGNGSAALYAHGAFVSRNGSCDNPMTPQQSTAISNIVANYPKRVSRYIAKCVQAWREFKVVPDCCQVSRTAPDADHDLHLLKHFQAGDPIVFNELDTYMANLRNREAPILNNPDAIASHVERELEDWLKPTLIKRAIEHVDPDFTYPQIPPRRR